MTEIQFQIIDILSDDIPNDKNDNTFIITLYGINQNNERIVCHVTKFLPYFFIKIPNDWEQPIGVKLIKDILEPKPGEKVSLPDGTICEVVKITSNGNNIIVRKKNDNNEKSVPMKDIKIKENIFESVKGKQIQICKDFY